MTDALLLSALASLAAYLIASPGLLRIALSGPRSRRRVGGSRQVIR